MVMESQIPRIIKGLEPTDAQARDTVRGLNAGERSWAMQLAHALKGSIG
jgi:hypothetical protein